MDTETGKAIQCVGFIMDGNRRWAQERGLDTLEGHRAGYESFVSLVEVLRGRSVSHAVFYAFSTENWGRTEREVSYLMELFETTLVKLLAEVHERGVAVKIVGDTSRFSEKLQALMAELEEKSAEYAGTTIWLALSYGGRPEIISAVNRAMAEGGMVTEDSFEKLLWTAGMPDPDLIIRTGGEQRLSNFLPWQSVYSELFFVDTYWPDFNEEEFQGILEVYGTRHRRKGI